MNLKFLGDALDHWKGSVFEGLQRENLFRDFRVDAMASDAVAWQQTDYELYAKLLRIHVHQILSHKNTLDNPRHRYFAEIPPACDLFLDPDIGFKTGKLKDLRRYITASELFSLMEKHKERIVVVYQHVRGKTTRDRVEEVLLTLRNTQPQFFCASYESGTVALLFFSFERGRIVAITKYFRTFLLSHANNRIGQWE